MTGLDLRSSRMGTSGNGPAKNGPMLRYETWSASPEEIAEFVTLEQHVIDAQTPDEARQAAQKLRAHVEDSRRRHLGEPTSDSS
jgi:hypothetical protein